MQFYYAKRMQIRSQRNPGNVLKGCYNIVKVVGGLIEPFITRIRAGTLM